jgi:hypothetical protein
MRVRVANGTRCRALEEEPRHLARGVGACGRRYDLLTYRAQRALWRGPIKGKGVRGDRACSLDATPCAMPTKTRTREDQALPASPSSAGASFGNDSVLAARRTVQVPEAQ